MKKITGIIFCVGILLSVAGQQRQKKAVFIIADGIPADVIEKLNMPALHTIAKEGSWLHAYVGGEKGGYSQTPTISAVGYNSLLTGTWVNKHNVWDNDIAAPNYAIGPFSGFLKNNIRLKKQPFFLPGWITVQSW